MPQIFDNGFSKLYQSDARELPIPDNSVDCVVTSPPYWGLRDYGIGEQGIGLEPTPEEYCTNMVKVFREVWRVLKPTGTVWLNLGDSYVSGKSRYSTISGGKSRNEPVDNNKPDLRTHDTLKDKDLCGIPWRVAFALQADGWYLRSDIIWSKPNPMPESVTDRPTKAHEYVFLLTKSPRYYYDADAIREPHTWVENRPSGMERLAEQYRNKVTGKYTDTSMGGGGTGFQGHSGAYKADGTPLNNPLGRNKRSVWEITTQPYPEAHFATYPQKLVEPCILSGTSEKGVCAECGNPWERVVEQIETGLKHSMPRGMATHAGGHGTIHRDGRENGKSIEYTVRSKNTAGWQPTCTCNADTVPATVLDPFVGSGTTLLVAHRLGRKSIGVDLNDEYLEMAQKRLESMPIPMLLTT